MHAGSVTRRHHRGHRRDTQPHRDILRVVNGEGSKIPQAAGRSPATARLPIMGMPAKQLLEAGSGFRPGGLVGRETHLLW